MRIPEQPNTMYIHRHKSVLTALSLSHTRPDKRIQLNVIMSIVQICYQFLDAHLFCFKLIIFICLCKYTPTKKKICLTYTNTNSTTAAVAATHYKRCIFPNAKSTVNTQVQTQQITAEKKLHTNKKTTNKPQWHIAYTQFRQKKTISKAL